MGKQRSRVTTSAWILGVLAAAGCGPGPSHTKGGAATAPAVAAGPAEHLAFSQGGDVPPPANAPKPLAYKPFDSKHDLEARRPLVPQPSATPPPKTKGTVDESGDETALVDVLIGAAAGAQEKDSVVDSDLAKVPGGVRLVVDSPYEIFSKVGTYIHVGAWLPSFAPAAGARVFVDGKLRGRTDATGTFVFRDVPDATGAGGGSHHVMVLAGAGQGRVQGGTNYNAYARTAAFERANLYVYTDRGVFSPGDTVKVRAFAWRLRGDYRPFSGAPVNVMLRKDGKMIGGGRVLTDKLGVAFVDVPLPNTAPEGSYEIAVEHLGERATGRLQIKRIVAPAVKIEHTLPRFLTREEKSLPFEVTLASATGEPFKSGTIVARYLDPKGKEVARETRAVTGSGPHKLSIDQAKLDSMRSAFADDQLAAVVLEVTDAATGRKDELRRDLRISHAPWRLVVETDRNEHVAGETVKVVVHTTDLEQSPAPGMELEITAHSSNSEDTDPTSKKSVIVKTDADGLGKATFTMPKGYLDIQAKLVKAPSVMGAGYVSVSPPRAMFADVPVPSVTERAKTPIEVKFPSGYAPSEKVVHADVVDSSGALIHSFLVPITFEKGEYVARGTFPAPSWGSMLITFFAIGAEKGKQSLPGSIGLLTDGANLPVVASRPIAVTLKAPGMATPGQTVKVDLSVKGPDIAGKAERPFAVGVSMTEDALLALLDPLERTPTQVLYNPERKVMASTGAQILTWPVVQKTWGSWNYDIALPPFGFRPGGLPPVYNGKNAGGWGQPVADSEMGGGGYGYGVGAGGLASADKAKGAPPPAPPSLAKPSSAPAATAAPAKATGEAAKKVPTESKPDAYATLPVPGVPKKDVNITIRTDFSPTSLWIPDLVLNPGKDGVATKSFDAKLPDSITTQRLTVVATDDRGAVGIGKALIKVDQDVSVRSDLPAELTMGDEVEVGVAVRNTRKTSVSGTVSLSSTGLALVGAGTAPITVPAGSSAAVRFKVRAGAVGKTPFSVTFTEAAQKGRVDTEQRSLWVKPHGAPSEQRVAATLTGGKIVAFDVVRTKDDLHLEADLSVAFPSAVPLIEGLEDLADEKLMGVDPDASRVLAAIAIEGYLVRTKAPQTVVARVHEKLQRATAELLIDQQPDGGWGWRWDTWAAQQGLGSGSSPYVTTHALQALGKLRFTNVPVPDSAIASGRTYLLDHLDQNSDVDVSNVAFWEGDGPSKRRAATMSAFQAIALTEKHQKLWGAQLTKMNVLAKKAEDIVKGGPGSEDPLTLTSAVMGLWLHGQASNQPKTDLVDQGVKALLASYRGGYWEPSWFHAWGGRIEATRGVIELLTSVAPGAYDADLHDAVDFLLQTKPSWGAWHNAWGTAAAIEALTFLDPTPPEKAGATVTIAVDGKLVRTVKIDPEDPFTSAAALRAVDLSPFMTEGKHEVRLAYDGNLTVPASVSLKRWTLAKKDDPTLTIERALSASSGVVGATFSAQITLDTKVARPELTLEVPLAAGVSIDARALDALVKAGTINAYREGGSLFVSLRDVPIGKKSFALPLVGARKGAFSLSPVRVFATRSSAEATSTEAAFLVK